MGTSLESSKMDKSSVVKDITDFDINAPISVTICFEEDYDEIPIKTETVIDDQEQNTPGIDNSAFVPILEPVKEIQNETAGADLAAETQNITKDTTALQPENLHDKVIDGESKKRKAENIIDQCKKSKHEDQNYENGLTDVASKSVPSASVDTGLPSVETTANLAKNSGDINELRQHEIDKVNTYITNCLADVSEQLRRIMNAYDYHRRCQTPVASFNKIKKEYFNLAYKTVVTILLPEEKNDIFIQTFLNETVQRARKLAGPYYNRTYRDYANLLYEMFMWVKKIQYQPGQTQNFKEISGQSSETQNNITITRERIVQDTQNTKSPTMNSNISTEADKICIFSSGLPGNKISICIDPVLSEYFKKPEQINQTADQSSSENQPLSTNDSASQDKTTSSKIYLAKFAAKYLKNTPTTQHSAIVSPTTQVPNASTVAQQEQNHQLSSNNKSASIRNTPNYSNNVLFLQQNAQAASLQQQKLLKPPPPYAVHTRAEQRNQQNLQYNQAQSSQPQIGQQQQLTMHYGQTNLRQSQQMPAEVSNALQQLQAQFQQRQQITPQYQAKLQFQSQMAQSRQTMPQYIQSQSTISSQQREPSQHSQLQHQVHQQQPRLAEIWPSLVDLLSKEPTHPPPFPSFNPLNMQSKYTESPNLDSWGRQVSGQMKSHNSQQLPAHQTEWQQEVNVNYQIGQVPQVTQKGAPRSASTDSGFISPLNFNMPTDQTTPMPPQEPETTIPVITHVTSLSDKVAFVELGSCVVCYKNTKQKCMGCMKVYYCTYQCQSQDWARHADFCLMGAQQNTNYNAVQFT